MVTGSVVRPTDVHALLQLQRYDCWHSCQAAMRWPVGVPC